MEGRISCFLGIVHITIGPTNLLHARIIIQPLVSGPVPEKFFLLGFRSIWFLLHFICFQLRIDLGFVFFEEYTTFIE
ncbi:hypothetical protein BDW42DRAFT_176200 [Aspergillus taichungensis]|uniref:Uncharacterized protein n=1 Tax=Aspergillus taichungensis TaxID=482145 RepID=A0A2J5HKZ4_9EURO|nr:hypothetical protein BDW42DRAFT_176200 [Aspergillus taichungensis]